MVGNITDVTNNPISSTAKLTLSTTAKNEKILTRIHFEFGNKSFNDVKNQDCALVFDDYQKVTFTGTNYSQCLVYDSSNNYSLVFGGKTGGWKNASDLLRGGFSDVDSKYYINVINKTSLEWFDGTNYNIAMPGKSSDVNKNLPFKTDSNNPLIIDGKGKDQSLANDFVVNINNIPIGRFVIEWHGWRVLEGYAEDIWYYVYHYGYNNMRIYSF